MAKRSCNRLRPWHLSHVWKMQSRLGSPLMHTQCWDLNPQRLGNWENHSALIISWNVSHICRIYFTCLSGQTKATRDICSGVALINYSGRWLENVSYTCKPIRFPSGVTSDSVRFPNVVNCWSFGVLLKQFQMQVNKVKKLHCLSFAAPVFKSRSCQLAKLFTLWI